MRAFLQKQSRNLVLLGTLGFLAIILLELKVYADQDAESQKKDLRIEAHQLTDHLETSLMLTSAHLDNIRAFIAASDPISEADFALFLDTSGIFSIGEHVRAVALMPEVPEEKLLALDAEMERRFSYRETLGYPVWKRFGEPAEEREYRYPATYAHSPAGPGKIAGFEVSSSPERMAAADSAREQGTPVMTAPIGLSQDGFKNQSVLIMTYAPDSNLDLPLRAAASESPLFIAIGYTPGTHIESVFKPRAEGFKIRVTDTTSTDNPVLMYADDIEPHLELIQSETIQFTGRSWQVEYFHDVNLEGTENFRLIVMLAGGATIVTLLLAFAALRLIDHEQNLVERVQERTARLEERNIQLQNANTLNERALQRVEEANITKAKFLASVSHEFRTPLNAIIGFTDLLTSPLTKNVVAGKQEEYLKDVHSSAAHMLDLVNKVLNITAFESGHIRVLRERLNLVRTVDGILASLEGIRLEKGMVLKCTALNDVGDVNLDRTVVRQIILNLVANALKFCPAGTAVDVTLKTDGDDVIISVSDHGGGVPAEAIDSITDPFIRAHADPMVAQEGSGLGLSIVKTLAETHDGEVHITNRPEGGATVVVTLSQREPEDA